MPNVDYPQTLLCHPATPAPVVRTVEAQVSFRPDGGIIFSYRLWGDMARLLVPQVQIPAQKDLLWEHTCFEAFIRVRGNTAYREFNFSPSGQWAAYAFSYYRQRNETVTFPEAPQISARLFAGRLELDAFVSPLSLPPQMNSTHLQIALSAVIEAVDTVDGQHSYWALHHPAPRPDFHHRETFALELADPRHSV